MPRMHRWCRLWGTRVPLPVEASNTDCLSATAVWSSEGSASGKCSHSAQEMETRSMLNCSIYHPLYPGKWRCLRVGWCLVVVYNYSPSFFVQAWDRHHQSRGQLWSPVWWLCFRVMCYGYVLGLCTMVMSLGFCAMVMSCSYESGLLVRIMGYE